MNKPRNKASEPQSTPETTATATAPAPSDPVARRVSPARVQRLIDTYANHRALSPDLQLAVNLAMDLQEQRGAEEPTSATWPIVKAFALRMEAKLERNRDKGDREGWLKDPIQALLVRLDDKALELENAIAAGDVVQIEDEAADVANFAMMIADVAANR